MMQELIKSPHILEAVTQWIVDIVKKALREVLSEVLLENQIAKELPVGGETDYLTREEAMEFIRVKPTKFWQLTTRDAIIPFTRTDKRLYFKKQDLINYMEGC